jgi:hypothetical protein
MQEAAKNIVVKAARNFLALVPARGGKVETG